MAVKLKLSEWPAIAAKKPAGYYEDFLAAGEVQGGYLVLSEAAYARLALKYGQKGDAVARVAKPFARVVDKALGTNLEGCGGCARRHKRWNGGDEPVSPA